MNLTAKIFRDEDAARAHIEASRWADGVTCPHCGSVDTMRMGGKTQAGMFLCRDCRDKFTCRTGTVMERSHTPLSVWFWAAYLVASQTPGMSAVQFQRQLGLTRYETAFGILHKLRAGMVRPLRILRSTSKTSTPSSSNRWMTIRPSRSFPSRWQANRTSPITW